MGKFNGKCIIVTGGASGIGRAISNLVASDGAYVAICDVNEALADDAVKEIIAKAGLADFYKMDVSSESSVSETFKKINNACPIYGLVNCAAVDGPAEPTHLIEEKEWDRIFAVNAKGPFFCTKHAIPYMLKFGCGTIVNISSSAALIGGSLSAYAASKGAVRSMSMTDAAYYTRHNIRVNSVFPAAVDTPLSRNHKDPRVIELRKSSMPLKRLAKPEEIASVVAFLLSDDASWMSGSEVWVDGASQMVRRISETSSKF